MPTQEATTGSTIRAASAAGALVGLAPDRRRAALAAAGFTEAELRDPDRLLELDAVLRLTRAAAEAAGDDCLGLHMGAVWALGDLGVLGYAVLNAPTVGTGLRNLARYGRVHLQGGRITLEQTAGEAHLAYQLDTEDLELARQHVESAAVVGLRIVRHLAGEPTRPRRVAFGHRRPRDTREHARAFGCPVEFGARGPLRIVFDAALLERPAADADRTLLPIVEQHLDERVSRHAEPAVVQEVRQVLAHILCDGSPTLRTVARRCGASVRTLQRRLDEQGLAFRDLVRAVRLELAERYLAEPDASLTEVAFLLGYSELSAFDRAYRRWTGSTPLAARRRLLRRAARDAPAASSVR